VLIIFVLHHTKLHALHASEDAMWSVFYAITMLLYCIICCYECSNV